MIYINNLEIMRGTTTLLQEATATIYPHKRVGLVGRNGCGKSTLFAAIKGELAPETGKSSFPADGLSVPLLRRPRDLTGVPLTT